MSKWHTEHVLWGQRSEQYPGSPCGNGTQLALAHLWRSLAPVTWQAWTTLSRGTGARWLHPGLYPCFSSSQCPPLRWQRGVTQGQTPSGVTQIQPLAELLPPGPTTAQVSGGEVIGSGGHGSNSPGASHLPKPCPAGVYHLSPGCKVRTLSHALTGSQWQPISYYPANEEN